MKWVLVVTWLASGQPQTAEVEYRQEQTCHAMGVMSMVVLGEQPQTKDAGYFCLPREAE